MTPGAVATGPRDLEGERRCIRWLAALFSQDSDVIHGTYEFDGVVAVATLAFPQDDLPELQSELTEFIEDVQSSADNEAAKLERYWVKLGFEILPPKPVVEALEQIQRAIAARIAAS